MKLALIYEGSVQNLANKVGNKTYFNQPGLQKVPVPGFGDGGTGPQSGDELSMSTGPWRRRHRKYMRVKKPRPGVDQDEI